MNTIFQKVLSMADSLDLNFILFYDIVFRIANCYAIRVTLRDTTSLSMFCFSLSTRHFISRSYAWLLYHCRLIMHKSCTRFAILIVFFTLIILKIANGKESWTA